MRESKRYLGLELAGAKNQKTSLAVLEYYPKERKIFLLDVFDRILNQEDQTGDEALLELIQEISPSNATIGVNVPLDLPPCIECPRKTCPLPKNCTVPQVKWMREMTHQAAKKAKALEFTPYTQRPVELWMRYHVLPDLPAKTSFEIDETLGGNRAPLTARMHFLKRQLHGFSLVEVWPKLSTLLLASEIGIPDRILTSYRKLEEGVHAREKILIQLAQEKEIFIYERDLRKLSQNLTTFDAFICAYTALLADQKNCSEVPKGYPSGAGWVHYPA